MKRRRRLACLILWGGIALTPSWAENAPQVASPAAAAPAPATVVTSDAMEYDYAKGLLVFQGNVLVNDAALKLWADQLTIEIEGTNSVRSFVAQGNVRFEQPDGNRGSCRRMQYWREGEKAEMSGDVILFQGAQGASADKIVFRFLDGAIQSAHAIGNVKAILPGGAAGEGGPALFPSTRRAKGRNP